MSSVSSVSCYAKLIGPAHTVFYLTRPRATLGRKVNYAEGTLYESGELVPIADFFVGSSPSISRIHCVLSYNVGNGRQQSRYEVTCCSKNGMWVDGVYVTRDVGPYVLRSRALLLIGDAPWYFLLPRDTKPGSDALIRPPSVSYVSTPIITRSSRLDDEQREREREQRRRKEREERERLKPLTPASTSPVPSARSPTPLHKLLPPPLPPQDVWSRVERDAMKDALLTFACDRPDLLQRELKKENVRRSGVDLANFVATFIAALMKNAGVSITKLLKQLSPLSYTILQASSSSSSSSSSSYGSSRPPPNALFLTLLGWNAMTKHCKSWARRLLHLHALHHQMITRGSLHLLDDLTSAPRGRLPAVWWSRQCDVDLLIGMYKWGYNRFDDIKNDKELCFHAIMEHLKERRASGKTDDGAARGAPAAGDGEDAAGEGEEGGGEDNEDEDAAEGEDTDDDDEELDEDDDDDEDRPKKGSAGKPRSSHSSTPAASRPASPFSRTLTGQVSKGKTEDGWPISLALVGRFRQLLKVMKLRDAQQGEGGDGSRKRKGGDASGRGVKRVKRELVPGWTDEERGLFTKALLLVGASVGPAPPSGRWTHMRGELLQTTGPLGLLLRRPDAALDQRLEELHKEARELLVPLNEKQLLDSLHDRSLSLLSSLFTSPLAPTLPAALSPLLSSHLLSHLHYFHLSRTVLYTPPATTPPAPAPSPLCPPWWKAAIHDRALLLAVARHGLQLHVIDEDPGFPFNAHGGLEGWVKGTGAGVGMEWLVERWKTVVDFWVAQTEKETKKDTAGVGKSEARKERSSKSKSTASSSSSSPSLS